jgi:diguanylate cyclase (GGDEF)-like protein
MYGEMHLSKRELRSCMELGKTLTSELDPNKLFSTILGKLSEMIPADIWSLLLLDPDSGDLRFRLSVDLDMDDIKDIRIKLGQGKISGKKTTSVMCVPLIFGDQVVGVIETINPRKTSKKALSLLMFIADYAAIAVENTRRYQRIQSLANRDNLTGLYNTRYLYHKLTLMFEESKCSSKPFALIFMDLDNFKRVVDAHGHLNGSQAIQEVAATIRDSLAEPAFGVSYGGDEFVVVLPGYTKDRAKAKAEEIRSLMDHTVYLSNKGINISLRASFGVAAYPEDATNITRLLSVADRAMFNIKDGGKNGVGAVY